MNEYELLYVISPRLSADEVDATVERVGALIEDSGGSISMVDNWGRRRLAYPIRQHFEGVYVLTHCTLDGARAADIERALQLNENVLRHLLVRGIIPGYDGPPEQDVVETRRPALRPAAEEPAPADAEAPGRRGARPGRRRCGGDGRAGCRARRDRGRRRGVAGARRSRVIARPPATKASAAGNAALRRSSATLPAMRRGVTWLA